MLALRLPAHAVLGISIQAASCTADRSAGIAPEPAGGILDRLAVS